MIYFWTSVMTEFNENNRSKEVSIIGALKAGQQLANAEGFKKATNWINLAAALVGVGVNFIPGVGAFITQDIVDAAFGLLGAFNVYSTTATTTRIGI